MVEEAAVVEDASKEVLMEFEVVEEKAATEEESFPVGGVEEEEAVPVEEVEELLPLEKELEEENTVVETVEEPNGFEEVPVEKVMETLGEFEVTEEKQDEHTTDEKDEDVQNEDDLGGETQQILITCRRNDSAQNFSGTSISPLSVRAEENPVAVEPEQIHQLPEETKYLPYIVQSWGPGAQGHGSSGI
ncbi:hypothetical protein Baya_17012 [Bagarius yarrelli]|uniref:Uncharacterized protein n=1 Tax=Bagarius yarrelli TaxID=175774 RepID=A0A556VX68_BAGYA|nr:hypothetical protein Baya_17012 [Bagarius yarrelli]